MEGGIRRRDTVCAKKTPPHTGVLQRNNRKKTGPSSILAPSSPVRVVFYLVIGTAARYGEGGEQDGSADLRHYGNRGL